MSEEDEKILNSFDMAIDDPNRYEINRIRYIL